ncbi:MAG TPA: polysaccharide deacetylase, partial [Mycobacteriales bacterium]
YVPLAGTGSGVVSMDYNFWVKQTGNPPSTRDTAASSAQVLATYRAMYAAAYGGNRAPLVLGNHFNSWNGNAYTQALAAFVQETCRKPETMCVPYRDVVAWMEAQTPGVLAALQARPPVYTVG